MAPTNEACESYREKIYDHLNERIKTVKESIPKNNKVSWTHFIVIVLALLTAVGSFVYVMTQRVTKVEANQEHIYETLKDIKDNQKQILSRLNPGK